MIIGIRMAEKTDNNHLLISMIVMKFFRVLKQYFVSSTKNVLERNHCFKRLGTLLKRNTLKLSCLPLIGFGFNEKKI